MDDKMIVGRTITGVQNLEPESEQNGELFPILILTLDNGLALHIEDAAGVFLEHKRVVGSIW